MIVQLVIAAAIVAVAIAVGLVARRRRPDAPTQPRMEVPAVLDRADFVRPEAPWLVAVFSSATCASCADVVGKAAVLASDEVAVDDVEYSARRDVHARYGLDAVPIVAIADAEGAVVASFVGPVSATDLWSAMASLRS